MKILQRLWIVILVVIAVPLASKRVYDLIYPKGSNSKSNDTAVAQQNDALALLVGAGKTYDVPAGAHEFRHRRISSSPDVIVGCVPCYNVFTMIAIVDGKPYSVNGTTTSRASRYSMVVNGVEHRVRSIDVAGDLSLRIEKIPGCDAPTQLMERMADALTGRRCLGN